MIDSYILSDIMKTNLLIDYIKGIDSFYLLVGYIIYTLCKNFQYDYLYGLLFNIYCWNGFNYNELVLSGNYCTKHSTYSSRTISLFGDNFKALWTYINRNHKTIHRIKEITNIHHDELSFSAKDDIYIANQDHSFVIRENDIYGRVNIRVSENDNKEYSTIRNENIELSIFSYTLSCSELKEFVNSITRDYKNEIMKKKQNKKFIYTLKNIDDEGDLHWYENEFESTRTFDNMYFENKKNILKEIDFFSNNEQWYVENGEPYNLGIGLKGVPGTGKTTFIKCLANKLKRHIIQIPLNRIKTEEDFFKAFYEKIYVNSNENSIDFKDKIIVFEDIDCMSDVILKRKDHENDDDKNSLKDVLDTYIISNGSNITAGNNNNVDMKKTIISDKQNSITLSFILNTIDGLIETSGRIIVISSNYYDKLDDALIRPGRIDMFLELKKYNISMVEQLYEKFYDKKLTKYQKKQLENIEIAPCEIMNLRKRSDNNRIFYENLLYRLRQ